MSYRLNSVLWFKINYTIDFSCNTCIIIIDSKSFKSWNCVFNNTIFFCVIVVFNSFKIPSILISSSNAYTKVFCYLKICCKRDRMLNSIFCIIKHPFFSKRSSEKIALFSALDEYWIFIFWKNPFLDLPFLSKG